MLGFLVWLDNSKLGIKQNKNINVDTEKFETNEN